MLSAGNGRALREAAQRCDFLILAMQALNPSSQASSPCSIVASRLEYLSCRARVVAYSQGNPGETVIYGQGSPAAVGKGTPNIFAAARRFSDCHHCISVG